MLVASRHVLLRHAAMLSAAASFLRCLAELQGDGVEAFMKQTVMQWRAPIHPLTLLTTAPL